MRILAAAALLALVAGLAWPALRPEAAPEPAPPAFAADHFDSKPEGDGYRETWCVTRVPAGWRTANVTATLDGAAIALGWVADDGTLHAGSRFTLHAVEHDLEHELALAYDGATFWSVRFGAGAGTPVGCRT